MCGGVPVMMLVEAHNRDFVLTIPGGSGGEIPPLFPLFRRCREPHCSHSSATVDACDGQPDSKTHSGGTDDIKPEPSPVLGEDITNCGLRCLASPDLSPARC